VTRVALSRILNGGAGISADMALKLADALGTSPELWIGMQTQYDLWRASQRRRKKVTPFFVGAGRHDSAVESHSSQSTR
jgi:plasmid maintenance system antidote protein VapI